MLKFEAAHVKLSMLSVPVPREGCSYLSAPFVAYGIRGLSATG